MDSYQRGLMEESAYRYFRYPGAHPGQHIHVCWSHLDDVWGVQAHRHPDGAVVWQHRCKTPEEVGQLITAHTVGMEEINAHVQAGQ